MPEETPEEVVDQTLEQAPEEAQPVDEETEVLEAEQREEKIEETDPDGSVPTDEENPLPDPTSEETLEDQDVETQVSQDEALAVPEERVAEEEMATDALREDIYSAIQEKDSGEEEEPEEPQNPLEALLSGPEWDPDKPADYRPGPDRWWGEDRGVILPGFAPGFSSRSQGYQGDDTWVHATADGIRGAAEWWWMGAQTMDTNIPFFGNVATGIHKGLISGLYNAPIDIYNAVADEPASWQTVNLDEAYGRPDGTGAAITQGFGSFLTWFIPIGGAAKAATKGMQGTMKIGGRFSLGTAGAYTTSAVGAGAVSDFLAFDPAEGNLSTVMAQTGWFEDTVLQDLFETLDSSQYAGDPKTRLMGRFANAAEGVPLGIAFDGLFKGAARGAKNVTDVTTPTGYPLRVAQEWTVDMLSTEAQRQLRQTISFAFARMARAEELYAQGIRASDINLHLQREGFGFDKFTDEHLIPALGRVAAEQFGVDRRTGEEMVLSFIEGGGDPARAFIFGGETITAGQARVMLGNAGESATAALKPDEVTPGTSLLREADETDEAFQARLLQEREAAGTEGMPIQLRPEDPDQTVVAFKTDEEGTPVAVSQVDLESGVAFLGALKKLSGNNPQVGVHEFGHVLQGQILAGDDEVLKAKMKKAFGVTDETGWGSGPGSPQEAFADAWEAFLREPAGVRGARKNEVLGHLAAQMRDVYRDIKDTPAAKDLSDEARTFFDGLERRSDLPIRYAPGKYMPAIDFSEVLARVQKWDEEGLDWRDQLEAEDLLAVARIGKKGDRGGKGNIRPGLDEEQGAILNADGLRRAQDGTYEIRTDDDLLKLLAAQTELMRLVIREVKGGKVTDEELYEETLRQFNKTLGRTEDQLNQTVDEFMVTSGRNPREAAAKVMAMQMTMLEQLKRVKVLSERATRTGNVSDYARLQKAHIQLQYIMANASIMRSVHGNQLRAWGLPINMPSDAALADAAAAQRLMDQVAQDSPSSQTLADMYNAIDADRRGLEQAAHLGKGSKDGKYGLNVKGERLRRLGQGLFTNWLLSGPKTWFGLSIISPTVTMAIDGAATFVGGAVRRFAYGDPGGTTAMKSVVGNFYRNMGNTIVAARLALDTLLTEEANLMPQIGLRDDRYLDAGWKLRPGMEHPGARGMDYLSDPDGNINPRTGQPWTMVDRWIDPRHARWVNPTGRLVERGFTNIIQSFDEFFRQVNARTHLYDKLYRDHIDQMVEHQMRQANGAVTSESTRAAINRYRRQLHGQAKQHAEERLNELIREGRLQDEVAIRERIMNDPAIQAIEDPIERGKAIVDRLSKEVNPEDQMLIAHGKKKATDPVFQGELGPGGKALQNLLDNHTFGVGRLIIPFFRTPMNIIDRFGQYMITGAAASAIRRAYRGIEYPEGQVQTDSKGNVKFDSDGNPKMTYPHGEGPGDAVAGFHKKHWDAIHSDDPVIRAEATGRQIVGAGMIATAWTLFEQDVITGRGPTDKYERQAWLAAGYVPYSINFGKLAPWLFPEGTTVSFAKLDPHFMFFAATADTLELIHREPGLSDDESIGLMTALLYSSMSMMEQKSYIQGLVDLFKAMEDPEQYAEAYIRNFGTSATPFSSMARNFYQAADPVLRDTTNFREALATKTMFGAAMDTPPPVYTGIGTELRRVTEETGDLWSFVNVVSPVAITWESTNPVYRGLADLNRVVRPPRVHYRGLDLRDYQAPGDEYRWTAWHAWQEMTGKLEIYQDLDPTEDGQDLYALTVEEALHQYFDPEGMNYSLYQQHQRLDAEATDPQHRSEVDGYVHDLVSDYRDLAFQHVLNITPQLQADLNRGQIDYIEGILPENIKQHGEDSRQVQGLREMMKQLKIGERDALKQLQPVSP